MTYQSSIGFLGMCLLGSTLLAGCKDTDTQTKALYRPVPVARTQPPPQPIAMYAPIPPKPPTEWQPVEQQPAPVQPVGYESPAQPQPTETVAQPPVEQPVVKAPSHRGEEQPQRKSYADISAHPSFAHAPDYSWLSGEVEYSRISKGWRLRYATVDEEDAYGGSVTLAEHPLLHSLKDGEVVRVQGRLSNPATKSAAPPYLIDSLQPVGSSEPPAGAAARSE
jgi:hypothetical protein